MKSIYYKSNIPYKHSGYKLRRFSVSLVRILERKPSCFSLFLNKFYLKKNAISIPEKKAHSIAQYYNTNFHGLGFIISVMHFIGKIPSKEKT
jgi:hypothetical protein